MYCYESFIRGEMTAGLREGIQRFVAAQEELATLDVHWFGGEPFLAPDTVLELMEWFRDDCASRGIRFTAASRRSARERLGWASR